MTGLRRKTRAACTEGEYRLPVCPSENVFSAYVDGNVDAPGKLLVKGSKQYLSM